MKFKISPLSDAHILSTSYGEVNTAGLFDSKRDRPVIGGLHCERIFGPLMSYKCSCGQLVGRRYAGRVCNTCQVEVNHSSVRNVRFGHIYTNVRYINPLNLKLANKLLGIPPQKLDGIANGKVAVNLELAGYEPATGEATHNTVIDNDGEEWVWVTRKFDKEDIKAGYFDTGVEHLATLVDGIDSKRTMADRSEKGCEVSSTYLKLDNFDLPNLFNAYLPVCPAEMRPFTISEVNQTDNGTNELYRRVLRIAFQVAFAKENAQDHAEFNSMMLGHSILIQKATRDLLKDGATMKRTSHKIPGIIENLKGKGGRFRQNLLGKRVDFSGRSAITTNPALGIPEIGVPEKAMIELLRPHIIHKLRKLNMSARGALRCWEDRSPAAYEAMYQLMEGNRPPWVLLNRAPSLHRYSVGACKVVLHKGKSLQLPPEVCSNYNADHDGDTMAIHLLLSDAAYYEAKDVCSAKATIFQSSNGGVSYSLSHEQVVGAYYLTYRPDHFTGDERPIFGRTSHECITQWEQRRTNGEQIEVQWPVLIYQDGKKIETSIGTLLVERALQVPAGYVVSDGLNKGSIASLLKRVAIENLDDPEHTLRVTKDLGRLGFEWGTKMGLSIAYDDCTPPSTLDAKRDEGDKFEADKNNSPEMSTRNWSKITGELEADWLAEMDDSNPLKFMFMTKARVSPVQIRQMAIWKGQIADPSGGVVLVKNSLAKGLTAFEYMLTCKGTRQSLGANHEVVPQSGYLCRQLVHAGRELHVGEHGDTKGFGIPVDAEDAIGRYDFETGELITSVPDGVKSVLIQSPVGGSGALTTHEMGIDPSTHKLTRVNQQCGIIMGQTKAEKSTQLALRSKHLSGAIQIADDTDKKLVIKASGEVVDVTVGTQLTQFTVVDKDGGRLGYIYHTNDVTMIRKSAIEIGRRVRKGDIICVYNESVQGADISGTLAQMIKLIGASNPGKSFNFPRSVVTHRGGRVSFKVRTATERYAENNQRQYLWSDTYKDLKAYHAQLREAIEPEVLATWLEGTPEVSTRAFVTDLDTYIGEVVETAKVIKTPSSPAYTEADISRLMNGYSSFRPVVEFTDAAMTRKHTRELVDIMVGGEFIGTCDDVNAILVAEGEEVEPCTKLTYGLPDIHAVWANSNEDVAVTWQVLYKELKELYNVSGVNVNSIHTEVMFRSMIEIGELDGRSEIRSDCAEATPKLLNISQVPLQFPSLIKSISFGWIEKSLSNALLKLESTRGCSSERLVTGGLIPSSWERHAEFLPK